MGDNVLALLTRTGDRLKGVRRILERIATGPAGARDEALAELFIFAGLRKIELQARREARKMPILNDIMDNKVIGPAIRKGLRQGREQGREQGRLGQVEMLLGQIEKRFGRVPPAVGERITALKPAQLKRAGLRLLDAQRIEDLFAR